MQTASAPHLASGQPPSQPFRKGDTSSFRFEVTKWLPVFFVWFLILSLYGIYMGFHLVPALENDYRGWPLTKVILFNIVFFGLVFCYICSIVIPPGSVPDGKEEDPTAQWVYVEKKRTGDKRHCKWCAKYKPDRCHHCRVCRTCILRMDHHCPWIFNCVGFRNHKYFFLLLVYAAICCQIILWTMLFDVLEVFNKNKPFVDIFCLLFGETLAVFLGVLVTLFLAFHVWLMLKAMSTIEFCEKQGRQGSVSVNKYDRGVYGNICAVLGDNPLLWLLPCSLPSGDGLSFTDENMPLRNDMETGHTSARMTATSSSTASQWLRGQQPGSSAVVEESVKAVAGTGSAPDTPSRLPGQPVASASAP